MQNVLAKFALDGWKYPFGVTCHRLVLRGILVLASIILLIMQQMSCKGIDGGLHTRRIVGHVEFGGRWMAGTLEIVLGVALGAHGWWCDFKLVVMKQMAGKYFSIVD